MLSEAQQIYSIRKFPDALDGVGLFAVAAPFQISYDLN